MTVASGSVVKGGINFSLSSEVRTSTKVYSYEEALVKCERYFNGDELAAKVFLDKYALRNRNNELVEETPTDMHWRIAKEIARIEKNKFVKPMSETEVFSYLDKFKRIVPQGSPMYGIGNPYQTISLSNCYVLQSPEDSYGSILKTDEELVQISKRRGGNGLDISNLRPEGTPTNNAAKTSTGILSFMERYSNSIREVGQSGRRGALMITLSCHHPEIIGFTQVKNDKTKVTGANISVRLSDEFLSAVREDEEYELRWPVDAREKGEEPKISRMVKAREVWNEIVKNAHGMAEPGLLFWDNILRESPADCYYKFGFRTICTNPCAELPLSLNDSCRLLLLNVLSYVVNPFTENAYFDYDSFYADAQIAQRFMDDIIDLEIECINSILDKVGSDPESATIKAREVDLWRNILLACKRGRRTGTGVTAIGDTLAALGIPYTSTNGINTVEKIYRTLKLGCYRSSVDMAKELGTFPVWDHELEKDNPFLRRIEQEDPGLWEDMKRHGRRNIALLTTAPTGSVSLLTQTSGGIEPEFSIDPYTRRKKGNPGDANFRSDFVDQNGDHWQEFTVWKPTLKKWMEVTGETDYNKSPWRGSCAPELNWKDRVKLQAAAQRHVDHSISSTLNLPSDATVEQVNEIYLTAWEAGCKGITIYRDGCRTGVMVKKEEEKSEDRIGKTNAPKRPDELPCAVHHISVKGQEYFVLVGLLHDDPYEIFAGRNGCIEKKVKTGTIIKEKRGRYHAVFEDGSEVKNINEFIEDDEAALTRMISTSLRHGVDINYVVHQLQKIRGEDMFNFAKCVARALKKHIPDDTKITGDSCMKCEGPNIVFREGCHCCMDCGHSKCT